MAELDTIKRERIGGLMLCRDWGKRGPWLTWPKRDQPDFSHLSRTVDEVIRAAGLHDELPSPRSATADQPKPATPS